MSDLPTDPAPATGLRRFHKVTISAAIGFLLLMTIHYWRGYAADGHSLHLVYGAISAVAAIASSYYLWRFARSQSLG